MEQAPAEPNPAEIISGSYLNRALNKLQNEDTKEQIDRETTDKIRDTLCKLRDRRKEDPKAVATAVDDAVKQFKKYDVTKELITLWMDLPELEDWSRQTDKVFIVSDTRADEIKSNIATMLGIPKRFTVKLIANKDDTALSPQTHNGKQTGILTGAIINVQILQNNKPICGVQYALNEKSVKFFDTKFKLEKGDFSISDIPGKIDSYAIGK